MRRPRAPAARPILLLGPRWRVACTVLQVVPLPGVGAVLAGWRNPHTRLRTHGILQAGLVLFGSWPLVVPGAAGLVWAAWDAAWIWRAQAPGPLSRPAPGWQSPEGDAGPAAAAEAEGPAKASGQASAGAGGDAGGGLQRRKKPKAP